ncbi:hypothetical protein AB0M83_10540 [Amycolatopsis sp. NPDC051106]|uniref:hypothetical protein n=1 Tax=unclassified Amycolatopsis TaxID=2618356 RepID=UPI003444E7C4
MAVQVCGAHGIQETTSFGHCLRDVKRMQSPADLRKSPDEETLYRRGLRELPCSCGVAGNDFVGASPNSGIRISTRGKRMKSTPAATRTATNLAESDDRSDAGRGIRATAALTVTHLAERDEHGGTGRGVTMYNKAGTADAAAKPH